MIMKQPVKNEQIKRKHICSSCFVNVFKIQENKFKIVQKNFKEVKIILIKKDFLKKQPVTVIITWQMWVVKGWRLAVIDCWPALICSGAVHLFCNLFFMLSGKPNEGCKLFYNKELPLPTCYYFFVCEFFVFFFSNTVKPV